jgi:hypothetical protein
VPYEFTYDAQPGQVIDTLVVPVGPARIIVHNSMYSSGPDGLEYRLGVAEWGMPCTPIPAGEKRDELIDRSTGNIGPRQTITGKKLGKGPPLKEPKRHDPISLENPRGQDGAFPGFYGEPSA